MYKIAIRTNTNEVQVFKLDSEEPLEEVFQMVKEDVPQAKVVLIGIDGGKGNVK